jgi:glycosyltransferase involved in cell wall biosynthesis
MEQWRQMRVALVVTGGVDRTGRERVIPALLSFIERIARRHTLVVYALRYHEQACTYPLLGATVNDLGRPRGLGRQYAALVDALRRDGPFDVLHAYWVLPAGLATALAGRRLGIPTLVTLDSGELAGLPEIGYGLQRLGRQRLAVAATLRLATRLSVCTHFMARLARAHHADAVRIPIGVDTRRFVPAPRQEGPPWRLLQVASLSPVKDQTTLLTALRHLLVRVPDLHLDIAGEDTLGGAMQALATRLGVGGHVTFHGVCPSDALVPLYQAAHLLVISSRHEAAGVVALEAAACGVPTLGSNVGYVADWAPDRAVGVPPGDPVALADAAASLLADAPRRARLAASAREWTLAHDADATADEFDRLYRRLARPPRRDTGDGPVAASP